MKFTGWLVFVLVCGNLSTRAEFDWEKAQRQYEENVRVAARYPFREFEKAAKSGDVTTVKRLLDQGVPVSLQIPWPEESFEGIPPSEQAIHHAAGNDQLEVVRLLLDRGADPNAHGSESDLTPLHMTKDIGVAKLLISRGADVNARDNQGWRPVHHATWPTYLENRREEAVARSIALVKLLIEHGADPLTEDDKGYQPIHVAANYGTAEMVSFLLEKKAKVDAKTMARPADPSIVSGDEYGWQPLHYAASRIGLGEEPNCMEDFEIAKLLIQKGADVNATASNGATALHLAKNPAVIRLLLEKGAKIDATTGEGWQPIHFAAAFGDTTALQALIKAGANPAAKTRDGKTALQIARDFKKDDRVKFLQGLK